MKNIAIFASGNGSNFKFINKKIKLDKINAKILLLVSNNLNSGAYRYAKQNGINAVVINNTRYPLDQERNQLMKNTLLENNIDLICLAGYMKLLPLSVVKFYNKCIKHLVLTWTLC